MIKKIAFIAIDISNPIDSIRLAHTQGSTTCFDILINLSNGIFYSYGLNILLPLFGASVVKCTQVGVLSKSSAYKSHSSNNSGLVRK